MKKTVCFILSLIIIMSSCAFFTGCGNDNSHPTLVLELDPEASSGIGGTVKIELYPEWSPNSVNFMIWQVQQGYYDNLTAFRCVPETLVGFGDAWNRKKINRVIDGEFPYNDRADSGVSFETGIVGMWYDEGAYDSCYGSFFICLSDSLKEAYEGKYAPVGKLTEGMETLIEASMLTSSEVMKYEPMYSITIKKATLLLHGKTYDLPVTRERTDYPGTEYR